MENQQDNIQLAGKLIKYGFDEEQVPGIIEILENISNGTSIPIDDFIYLYGTMKVQNVIFIQDIRQLQGRGIPILMELSKQFNVSQHCVRTYIDERIIMFKHIELAFKSLTDESGIFYDLISKRRF
ncbi:hypothetical protein AB6735_18640 [Mucilaginibacter sp. RCC_168]|uniref:hypothetical protein n=1 Tax=Mucilaginibacter sp. RCC_168 TaxID=3239221 RepID=UPI0035233C27